MTSVTPPTAPFLSRSLTLVPAAALIITNVIGTGVFLKARVMTCNVGSPSLVLLAWATAGVLTLGGALCFAELSAMMPRSGGQYNFIDAAFGKLWAFHYGWMETLLDGAASIAAISTVFVIVAGDLLSRVLTPFQIQTAAAGTIFVVTLLNLASVHSNGLIASIVTALKIMLVAGIGIAAFVFGGPISGLAASAVHGACEGVPEASRLGIAGFGAAMVGALWAYNGWSDLSMVAEEVRDPDRTIPRADRRPSGGSLRRRCSHDEAVWCEHRFASHARHNDCKLRSASFDLPVGIAAALRDGARRTTAQRAGDHLAANACSEPSDHLIRCGGDRILLLRQLRHADRHHRVHASCIQWNGRGRNLRTAASPSRCAPSLSCPCLSAGGGPLSGWNRLSDPEHPYRYTLAGRYKYPDCGFRSPGIRLVSQAINAIVG